MALTPLYEDDFSGYSSTVEVEDAYPYDPPSDLSSSLSGAPDNPYVRWGIANGPGGVPGLQNVTYDGTEDGEPPRMFALSLDKVGLETRCRGFQVEGTWDFTSFNPAHPLNGSSGLIEVFSYEIGNRSESFDGSPIFIGRHHSTGTLVVTIQTTPAYGNSITPPGLYGQEYAGAIPELGIFTIRATGQFSILTETSPGVWAPSTDGSVQVFVNNVLLFSFEGPVWHGDSTVGNRTWNSVTWKQVGRFTNARVWDSDECGSVPPDGTELCECVPPSGSNPPPVLPPPITNPPPQEAVLGDPLSCLGGGIVPIQDDFAPSEVWWGM
jgi:hypothetical protein